MSQAKKGLKALHLVSKRLSCGGGGGGGGGIHSSLLSSMA